MGDFDRQKAQILARLHAGMADLSAPIRECSRCDCLVEAAPTESAEINGTVIDPLVLCCDCREVRYLNPDVFNAHGWRRFPPHAGHR